MYLNDLNSAQHNVKKLNRILADTFNHEIDLSEMSTNALKRMLSATTTKMDTIKESDLKYWENEQYNKLGLIAHQLKTYITEIAPTRSDGKKMKAKNESVVMEDELDTAEVLLAANELVDEMQAMVEDVAEMQVQKLMPIVDAMKEQISFEVAEAYNASADAALGALLDQMKVAKEALENATLGAQGKQPNAPAPTDMEAQPEEPMDMDADLEAPDEFGGDDAEAGEENPIGRELKGESALADMEGKALAEKKFLESKDRLFKMVESGKMTQEQFINIISEFQGNKKTQENMIAKQRRLTPIGAKPEMTPMAPPAGVAPDLPTPDDISGQGMIQKQRKQNTPSGPTTPTQPSRIPVPMPRMAPKTDTRMAPKRDRRPGYMFARGSSSA